MNLDPHGERIEGYGRGLVRHGRELGKRLVVAAERDPRGADQERVNPSRLATSSDGLSVGSAIAFSSEDNAASASPRSSSSAPFQMCARTRTANEPA